MGCHRSSLLWNDICLYRKRGDFSCPCSAGVPYAKAVGVQPANRIFGPFNPDHFRLGNDRPVAFSVECVPPRAGDPVPQEFQPSLAHHIHGMPDSCHADSSTTCICIHKIEQSCHVYAEPHGTTRPAHHVLSILRSAGFDRCYYP